MVGRRLSVILDSGGVIIRPNPNLVAEAASRLGLAVRADLVWESVHRADAQVFRGRPDPFSVLFGDALAPQQARRHEIWDAANRTYGPLGLWSALNPDASEFLTLLPAQTKRAVVTNSEGTAREEISRLGLLREVEPVFDSAIVGIEKPDPAIFDVCAAQLGVALKDCVYVSDTFDAAPHLFQTFILYDPFSSYEDAEMPAGVVRITRLRQALPWIGVAA